MLTKHIALVGITGVGKSTLMNILTGSNLAAVSNNAVPCTMEPNRYVIENEGVRYTLWDTRGLNEASELGQTGLITRLLMLLRRSHYASANVELRQFLRGNNPKISLILFCIDAKKIRVYTQWNSYYKIYVKFCRRKVKVGVVVTRMDQNIWNTDWRGKCEGMAMQAVGESLDTRLIEAVPILETLEDAGDCRKRILRLISYFS